LPRDLDGRTDAHGVSLIGYASGPGAGPGAKGELEQQAHAIGAECERRGFTLVELVYEREPSNGKALTRPGLAYALKRISEREALGLVVAELFRLTRLAAELGKIIDWLHQRNARLVAAAEGLDTDAADGQLAATLLVEVSGWERARLSERTRSGLKAARGKGRTVGRPAVSDNPTLRQRIAQMREAGMTLQAIADRLNEEGVPTVRGGALWRHSSVQAAAGYRRHPRAQFVLPEGDTNGGSSATRASADVSASADQPSRLDPG
jgi:DNA invertase Pin-like site-specific DNA recombinase